MLFRSDHLWFADDIFGLRSDWLANFADRLQGAGVAVPFTMQSRCDLMNEQAVDALARSGCFEVWLGAESGSQRVLDAMDKEITVEQIREARHRLGERGIRSCFFIQFGYPGETWADIELTVAMVADLLPDDIGVSVSYPLPGTRFHEMVKLELDDQANWEHSGDLAMMFKGSYGTERARINSSHMRLLAGRLEREKRSIVVSISQSRDNIGRDATWRPKVFAGGNAQIGRAHV